MRAEMSAGPPIGNLLLMQHEQAGCPCTHALVEARGRGAAVGGVGGVAVKADVVGGCVGAGPLDLSRQELVDRMGSAAVQVTTSVV